MRSCRPTKVVQAYQWLSCEKQSYCGPINGNYTFPKNEIPHKLLCDICQDGGWTSHKNYKMMFQG